MKAPKKTKILLQQALNLDGEARTVFLENMGDSDIKSQVETLLADEFQLKQFLATNKTTEQSQKNIKPGSLINRIRVIKLLGQGGMGSVYLGFDEKLERQVAIKSIRPEHLKNPATQQRFEREAQIMSKINHPSICQLYDYMETPEGDFLVLEYIKGKPLYQVPMTDEQKLLYLADLATALSVAHEHGIVHRDLKPDNIMVTEQGQLKVLDFGIAQSLATPNQSVKQSSNDLKAVSNFGLTQQGSLVGTIRYMSPEQAQGLSIDTASDLYALGIIGQEIFTHQGAYQINDTEQLLTDVRQGKRLELDGLAAPIVDLIEHLTQLEPSKRPTALQTVDQINAIINAPKVKRKKVIVTSVVIVGLALMIVLLWQWQQSKLQAANNQLINKYESQIDNLVKQAEQIYVLPIHAVNDEINALLKQGDELFNVIFNDNNLTEPAKNRLLGIILLEGEYFADAIPLLLKGQAENHLLADAWTRLYIQKASDFSDQHGFEQTMKDTALRESYLKPALQYIELTQKETNQVDPLFNAFVLSQIESFDAGLQAVNQLIDDESWNKEAVNLKALILYALMANARELGDWQQAKDYALMTAETYQRSTQMARSYPPSYISLCSTYLDLMSDGVHRSGDQVKLFTEQAITACENALKTQPENKYPMHLLTRIYMLKALWQSNLGVSADEALENAKHWNQKTNSLNDLYIHNWNKALILATEAHLMMGEGKVAASNISTALELFEKLLKIETEYQAYLVSDFLFVLSVKTNRLIRQDQEIAATVQQAQNLYDQAMLSEDLMVNEQWGLVNNMSQVYAAELWQLFQKGQNILPQGEQLLAFLSSADNMINSDPSQLITLANTHLLMADYLRREQRPLNHQLSNHLNQAEKYIVQALAINPNNHTALLNQAKLLTFQAFFENSDYSSAHDVYAQALSISQNNPNSLDAWANGFLIQAQSDVSPEVKKQALNSAFEKIKQALEVDPNNHILLQTLNEIQDLRSSVFKD